MFSEQKIFEKFKRVKGELENWKDFYIPLENFTSDVALLLNDVEAYNLASAYGIDCEMFVHPRKYTARQTSSFLFQKDFPLKEFIDYQLLKFQQSGLLTHTAKKYFTKASLTCDAPLRELSFKATFFSFAILVAGLALAIACLIVEKLKYVLKN